MQQLRVGYVGTGGNAQGHLRRLSTIEGVSIVACCDVVEERARAAAEQFGGRPYTDWRRMMDEVEMEVCYFSLPPFAHEGAEIAAVERGIHIFVEKPVVMDLELGIRTKEAIEKAGVLSSVGYQSRYQPWNHALRDFLVQRTIGMAVAERWGGIAGGPHHWWRVMEKSGGMLHEQATHQLDLLRFFAGEIAEVYKKEALRINVDQENHTIPDAEVVILEFASGAIGYITTSSALIHGGGGSRIEFIVEGHLRVRHQGNQPPLIAPEGAATVDPPTVQLPESIDHAFIEAIRTNRPELIQSDYADGLRTCAVTLAANQSAREGRPIRVPTV
ncbi:MAG: hypothetical protein KatS3mg115_0650 [Candidatus Poribacteria bacterium]|nr:MAG: hypothetical protein KatS3mg115_0650 [Candidatus Poribacteria bacterium]